MKIFVASCGIHYREPLKKSRKNSFILPNSLNHFLVKGIHLSISKLSSIKRFSEIFFKIRKVTRAINLHILLILLALSRCYLVIIKIYASSLTICLISHITYIVEGEVSILYTIRSNIKNSSFE